MSVVVVAALFSVVLSAVLYMIWKIKIFELVARVESHHPRTITKK